MGLMDARMRVRGSLGAGAGLICLLMVHVCMERGTARAAGAGDAGGTVAETNPTEMKCVSSRVEDEVFEFRNNSYAMLTSGTMLARTHHSFTSLWDPRKGKTKAIVGKLKFDAAVFGGTTRSSLAHVFDETWMLSRTASGLLWSKRNDEGCPSSDGPRGRAYHAAASITGGGGIIIYGGMSESAFLGDVWAGSLTDAGSFCWESKPQKRLGPGKRSRHGMALYADHKLVTFGGLSPEQITLSDTFVLSSATWSWKNITSTAGPGPGARINFNMVPVELSGSGAVSVFLFGGYVGPKGRGLQDLWRFSSADETWAKVSVGAAVPQARGDYSAVFLRSPARLLIFTGRDNLNPNGTRTTYERNIWSMAITAAGTGANPPTGTWTEHSSWQGTRASAALERAGAAAVSLGDASESLAMYGGDQQLGQRVLNDIWTSEGNDSPWTDVSNDAGPDPAPRREAGKAYLSETKSLLYGGIQPSLGWDRTSPGTCLTHTWFIDHSPHPRWHLVAGSSTATGPGARYQHAMAFAGFGRVVLFGGVRCARRELLGDTWVFKEKTMSWTPVASANSPAPRSAHGMAPILPGVGMHVEDFSSKATPVLLFGGMYYDDSVMFWMNDTYYYHPDEERWEQIQVSYAPSPRAHLGMASFGAGKVAVFGGRSTTGQTSAIKDVVPQCGVYVFTDSTREWTMLRIVAGKQTLSPRLRVLTMMSMGGPGIVTLFGGEVASDSGLDAMEDTWLLWLDREGNGHWDGPSKEIGWADIKPQARYAGTSSYLGNTRTALFGGTRYLGGQDIVMRDTWAMNVVCPVGTYLTSEGFCELCPTGTYNQQNAMNLACTVCPESTTTYQSGSTTIEQCVLCKQGAESPCKNQAQCSLVPDPGSSEFQPRVQCSCMTGTFGQRCEHLCPGAQGIDKDGDGQIDTIMTPCSGLGECNDGIDGDGTCHCNLFLWYLSPSGDCNPTWGFVVIVVSCVAILVLAFVIWRQFQKGRRTRKSQALAITRQTSELKVKESDLLELKQGWRIRGRDIKLIEVAGKGGDAIVWKGKWASLDDVTVAVKVMKMHRAAGHKSRRVLDDKEIMLMQRLRHPRLVVFFGAGQLNPTEYFICSEFMAGGDLRNFLLNNRHNREKIKLEQRLQFALDVAQGMAFLHKKNCIHRDLKSLNVLCDLGKPLRRCKIADFGLSKRITSLPARDDPESKRNDIRNPSFSGNLAMTSGVGSILWMAPELLGARRDSETEYSRAVDTYSYGIVLWEIASHRLPYSHFHFTSQIEDFVQKGGRPKVGDGHIIEGLHPTYLDIMQQCWKPDPAERPSFKTIAATMLEVVNDIAGPKGSVSRLRVGSFDSPRVVTLEMTRSLGNSFASTNFIASKTGSTYSSAVSSMASGRLDSACSVESDARTASAQSSKPIKRLKNLAHVAGSHTYTRSKTMDEKLVTKLQLTTKNLMKKSSL